VSHGWCRFPMGFVSSHALCIFNSQTLSPPPPSAQSSTLFLGKPFLILGCKEFYCLPFLFSLTASFSSCGQTVHSFFFSCQHFGPFPLSPSYHRALLEYWVGRFFVNSSLPCRTVPGFVTQSYLFSPPPSPPFFFCPVFALIVGDPRPPFACVWRFLLPSVFGLALPPLPAPTPLLFSLSGSLPLGFWSPVNPIVFFSFEAGRVLSDLFFPLFQTLFLPNFFSFLFLATLHHVCTAQGIPGLFVLQFFYFSLSFQFFQRDEVFFRTSHILNSSPTCLEGAPDPSRHTISFCPFSNRTNLYFFPLLSEYPRLSRSPLKKAPPPPPKNSPPFCTSPFPFHGRFCSV